ncbi:MAG: glycosyltransferase N-terminal domain-containing protein, partial [Planctomycetota bacterium]
AARRPSLVMAISTTTKTGFELANRKYPQHRVFYCPLDFSWAVEEALRRLRPQALVLAELELWPNLIRAAHRRGVRVAIVNGRLSDRSFRGYLSAGRLLARTLSKIDLIAAQDQTPASRFRQWGARADAICVAGSLKFEGADSDRENRRTFELSRLAGIDPQDRIFLAGSTQAPEDEYSIDVYKQLSSRRPALRLILVPRHPERFNEVAELLRNSSLRWLRRSELDHAPTMTAAEGQPWQALLVDVVGELAAWWGAASVGFVGGSFGRRGGQNMLEPAAYGVPVCFGPNTRNFRDIVRQLHASDAAETVHTKQELTQFVARCLDDPAWAAQIGERAARLVASQQGATVATVDALESLLPEGERVATETLTSHAA